MNKKFLVRTLAALMLSIPAMAQNYQAVPQTQMEQYAEAALVAINNVENLRCSNDGPNDSIIVSGRYLLSGAYNVGFQVSFESVQEVYINSDRNQPLIKLFIGLQPTYRVELEIETNIQRTEVLSLKKTISRIGRANIGTLDSPNMVDSWIPRSIIECRVVTN